MIHVYYTTLYFVLFNFIFSLQSCESFISKERFFRIVDKHNILFKRRDSQVH